MPVFFHPSSSANTYGGNHPSSSEGTFPTESASAESERASAESMGEYVFLFNTVFFSQTYI
jgi:hypothetical protein